MEVNKQWEAGKAVWGQVAEPRRLPPGLGFIAKQWRNHEIFPMRREMRLIL